MNGTLEKKCKHDNKKRIAPSTQSLSPPDLVKGGKIRNGAENFANCNFNKSILCCAEFYFVSVQLVQTFIISPP